MTAPLKSVAGLVEPIVELLVERIVSGVTARLAELGPEAQPKPMSVREAAQFCRVSERTIRRLLIAGQVVPHRAGRRVLVLRHEVLAALRQGSVAVGGTPTHQSEADRVVRSLLDAGR